MTLKNYKKAKLAVAIAIAIIVSQSIIFKNYFIPIATVVVAFSLLVYLRRQVKEVVADERDLALGGRSALLAIQIYSWIVSILMFVLYAFRDRNPVFETAGQVLAFSTCALMLIYSLIFKYYNRSNKNSL